MIESYLFRLVCLSLASFFFLHFALGLAVSWSASGALELSRRIAPRSAARLLLALRLLPAGLSFLVVIGLCAPSYLWLEPSGDEGVGFLCWIAAIVCAVLWGISVIRVLRALIRSRRCLLEWRNSGRETLLAGENTPVRIIESNAPLVALSGILRPCLAITRNVIDALPPDELAAALRHELAHVAANDNLKRLVVILAPGMLPFHDGFRRLEKAWAKFSEWAADDWATRGDERHSVVLASALLRVARMGKSVDTPILITSLSADAHDLSARVERLLAPRPRLRNSRRGATAFAAGAVLIFAGAVLAVITQPAIFHSVYRVLETLIR